MFKALSARMFTWKVNRWEVLPRRTHSFASSTLRMPAIAGDRWLLADALAIVATILLSFFYRALATRMCALLGFRFSH
jgi:hypothetical protein